MLVLVLLFIFIYVVFHSLYTFKNGGGNVIYIYFNCKKENIKGLDFLFKMLKLNKTLTYSANRVLNTCLFDNNLQNINNLAEDTYSKYNNFLKKETDSSFDVFVENVNIFLQKNLSVFATYVKLNDVKPDVIIVENPYNCFNKRNLKTEITEYTNLITQTKYYIVNQIAHGDQWTLINDTESEKRKNQGFKIEVFGSPFNTRLPYFGSLFETDEPFGRIGDAFEILEKLQKKEPLYWREELVFGPEDTIKITVNPPSSFNLQIKAVELLYEIALNRKIECYLDLQSDLYKKYKDPKLQKDKYVEPLIKLLKIVKYTIEERDIAYDLYNVNKTKKLAKPWVCIHFYN